MDVKNGLWLGRREFLAAGISAAAGLAVSPTVGFAATTKAKQDQNPFGDFKVGLQSYTFRSLKQPDQLLAKMKQLGLHYVEFYNGHVPVKSTPAQIKAVLNLCRENEVTVVGFGVENFIKDHDTNRAKFELGKALGLKYLSADPSPDSFDSLDKLVDEYKIAIAIHNHGINGKQLHRWYSAEKILDAVKNHNPLIGTCLDTGHLLQANRAPFSANLNPADEIRKMGARNFAIHLKDVVVATGTWTTFGKGGLDVPAVLRALREVKYQGTVNIEHEANPKDPTQDVQACIEVLKDSVRKVGAA
jgi:inosose dehydratase